jgi:hypothetical protein
LKPKYQKKKTAGCPEWILSGVRNIFEKAAHKPLTGKTPSTAYNDLNHKIQEEIDHE